MLQMGRGAGKVPRCLRQNGYHTKTHILHLHWACVDLHSLEQVLKQGEHTNVKLVWGAYSK
jgi:heterodisulfide reductase subunit B